MHLIALDCDHQSLDCVRFRSLLQVDQTERQEAVHGVSRESVEGLAAAAPHGVESGSTVTESTVTESGGHMSKVEMAISPASFHRHRRPLHRPQHDMVSASEPSRWSRCSARPLLLTAIAVVG
jgi:hypothetical protein